MQLFFDNVQDKKGNAIANANVIVTNYPSGTAATIYSANDAIPANEIAELQTDSLGLYQFYAPNGRYTITVKKNTKTIFQISDVQISDTTVGGQLTFVFRTVSAMVAAPFLFVGMSVRTLGYNDAGDGGINDYEIVAADTGVNDGQFYINLTGSTGQAKLIVKNMRFRSDSGGTIGRMSMGVDPVENTIAVIRSDSNNDGDIPVTVQIQRFSRTDTGVNPKGLRVFTQVDDPVSSTEWAISGELDNYSNSASTGNTAVSGVSRKFGTAPVFAGHFQVQDSNLYSPDTSVTSVIGMEINAVVAGNDHPTANSGFGNRQILDLIAISDDDSGSPNPGEVGMGLRIRCDNGTRSEGYFRYGIVLEDSIGGNPNPMETGIRLRTTGDRGLHITGTKTIADILCESTTPIGIILNGSYSQSAIRVPANTSIGWENTNAIKTLWSSVDTQFQFTNGGVNRAAFNLSGSPALLIGGQIVVKSRITGWGLPTGTATRTAFDTATVTTQQLAERVKALLDDLNINTSGHGLIGQ